MTEYFWCMTAYLLEEFFMLGGTASAICVFFSSRESRKKYILFSSASLLIIIVTYSLYKLGATIEHVNMGWMTWGEYLLAVTIFAYFVVSASVALSVILNIICAVTRRKHRKKHIKLAAVGLIISIMAVALAFLVECLLGEMGSLSYVFLEWFAFFPLI